MTEEQNVNPEAPFVPTEVTDTPEMEFRSSPEALAAAEEAISDIKSRSFSGRHPELGKMIKCQVCKLRHRGKQCEQIFKQLWVDEDLETGELSIQYATVPLPGQNATPRAILGAQHFAKKRMKQRPNATGNQVVELTRILIETVNKERFPEFAGRLLEAKRQAINTINNRRERIAKRIRREQRESRRINRAIR